MATIKIKAFVFMRDCGDGSNSCMLLPSKEKVLEKMGYSSEEEMNKKWGCFYDDGGYEEVEIEIEEKDGEFSLKSGFTVSTDDLLPN